MIAASSRYAASVVLSVTGTDGVTRPTIMPRPTAARTVVVTDYLWRTGDRADALAARAFGDETLWWVIADANPEVLDWTSVPPGTAVRIPSGG